jgi:hypothetical protein
MAKLFLTALMVVVSSLVLITLVVTIYAFSLAIQARGAPDGERIAQFGRKIGLWLTPSLQIVFTFLGARWMGRRASPWSGSGLVLGLLVVLLAVVSQVLFRWNFEMIDILWYALILLVGWLGGRRSASA